MTVVGEEIFGDVDRILQHEVIVREGINLPSKTSFGFEGALRYDATVLCSDFSFSTQFDLDSNQMVAMKIARMFLRSTCKLITSNGGSVVNFGSNNVKGIFLGDMRNTNAAICALKINI
ncbi:MAG: hypothetical protein GX638_01000, partial [Crenarchaeota archaeon]|nr:hypothetical protein [Thermoproteota archaeon]